MMLKKGANKTLCGSGVVVGVALLITKSLEMHCMSSKLLTHSYKEKTWTYSCRGVARVHLHNTQFTTVYYFVQGADYYSYTCMDARTAFTDEIHDLC